MQILPPFVFLLPGSAVIIRKFFFRFEFLIQNSRRKISPCPVFLNCEYGDFLILMGFMLFSLESHRWGIYNLLQFQDLAGPKPEAADEALFLHTSGTTSRPKALLSTLAAGGTAVLPAAGRFSASSFWKDIKANG
jgi:hypothetical protein